MPVAERTRRDKYRQWVMAEWKDLLHDDGIPALCHRSAEKAMTLASEVPTRTLYYLGCLQRMVWVLKKEDGCDWQPLNAGHLRSS